MFVWPLIFFALSQQASLDIMCTPSMVRTGEEFHINVQYTIREPLKADLHFDLLNENTKEWLSGNTIELPSSGGIMSIGMTVPSDRPIDLYIWKVYLSPRGETFPNMLDEKGLLIDIIDNGNTSPVCPHISPIISFPVDSSKTDYVVIDRASSNLTLDCSMDVHVKYQLITKDTAFLSFNLMDKATNEIYISGDVLPIHRGNKNMSFHFDLPTHNKTTSPLYIVVSIIPTHDAPWLLRLAEDRSYNIIPGSCDD